ncbi:phosphatase PAP2 family protein [Candidatus Woesearchaeota archaeon]|nr:MAG: phosphatase PAP2 family protein [Candidatus Woesearchaeota archaeon]
MFKEEVKQDVKALGGLPVFLLSAFTFYLSGNAKVALVLLAGLVIGYVIASSLRLLFWRKRPDKEKYHNVLSKIDAGSFPSMHSMRAAMLVTVLMMQFQRPVAYVVFGLAGLSVLWMRVYQKRHFTGDVIAGAVLGVVIIIGIAFALLVFF